MANWQRILDIGESWDKVCNNLITIQEASKEISFKLSELQPFKNEEIEQEKRSIIEMFNDVSNSIESDFHLLTEDFDQAMQCLYDWGDQDLGGFFHTKKKVCWIKTQ
jgi:hypothetical protein